MERQKVGRKSAQGMSDQKLCMYLILRMDNSGGKIQFMI
jgi:hypothetical protein